MTLQGHITRSTWAGELSLVVIVKQGNVAASLHSDALEQLDGYRLAGHGQGVLGASKESSLKKAVGCLGRVLGVSKVLWR